MHLKDHSNEKPQTKRKGYDMRNLFVTAVAVLLLVMVAPVQADEPVSGNVGLTTPRVDCQNTSPPMLAQGETEEIQPYEDHTWGGDPDDEDGGLVHWCWYVMNVLYHYSCDDI